MTEGALFGLLRHRYAAPAYALLPDVANGTGGHLRRRADAVAMSVWPSRGLELLGFELKSDRRDWLRELADPAKSEEVQGYCDRWWLVVSDADIVRPGELPATWGLLAAKGGKLAIKQDAPKLDAQPADRVFLAALLRSVAQTYVPRAHVEALVEERLRDAHEVCKRDLERTKAKAADIERAMQEFRTRTGLRLDTWNAGSLAEAIEGLRRADRDGIVRELRGLEAAVARIMTQVMQERRALERVGPALEAAPREEVSP